jgi:hypothetical protein
VLRQIAYYVRLPQPAPARRLTENIMALLAHSETTATNGVAPTVLAIRSSVVPGALAELVDLSDKFKAIDDIRDEHSPDDIRRR